MKSQSVWIWVFSAIVMPLLLYMEHPDLCAQQKIISPHGAMTAECRKCHLASERKPIRSTPEFDHNSTRFPLQGMHKGIYCTQCHTNLVFSHTGNQCWNCHADIHRRQMGGNCASCHTDRGWLESTRNIQKHSNRFPLSGSHAAVECESCHKNAAVGLYKGLNTDCAFCHGNDYKKAKSVDHVSAGFPAQCNMCHGMDGWNRRFNHTSLAGFPLTGVHAQQDCAQCHIGGRFKGTPAACSACHLAAFTATTNPNHLSVGFSQNCSECHNTIAWTPSSFNHSLSAFPLSGAHRGLACSSCHLNGLYKGTPADCYACHSNDYNSTADPNHAASGFSRTCTQCHSTSTWTGAVFTHNLFPIYSGNHAKKWSSCADCHPNSGNYAVFTCTTCHDKAAMDSEHRNNPNYQYNSSNCYSCHRTGQAD
jgi:hypothetical protein